MSEHLCHAMQCKTPVPPRMFMCHKHWYMVPKPLRDAVWEHYVPGQEIRKDPTNAYLTVVERAIRHVAVREGHLGVGEP